MGLVGVGSVFGKVCGKAGKKGKKPISRYQVLKV